MSAQTFRILLTSGRKVVLTSVASYTKADVPYYDGVDYRDIFTGVNNSGTQDIVSENTATSHQIPLAIGTAYTTGASPAIEVLTVADNLAHIKPRNQQHMMTVYQFTMASAQVCEIPFANVEAMYTDEAT